MATIATAEATTAAVLLDGTWHALPFPDLSALFAAGPVNAGRLRAHACRGIEGARLVLPLPSPSKVICCGLNYGDHIAETGRAAPRYPTLFAKYADTLTGPTDPVAFPVGLDVDWEAELAVVVGDTLRDASPCAARGAIAGYTVANDLSVRDWQRRTPQWFQGKAWDATTPLGPVVVTADELDPAGGLAVVCRVNGVERQRGDTRMLVFDCAALLSYISTFTVLRPGDVVLTGTPGGVGMGMTPPAYLAAGDVVETEIPGIGTLRNIVNFNVERTGGTRP
ncbi:fumarylacetoacetate hydrolase family protein [Nocardioides sp. AN3]